MTLREAFGELEDKVLAYVGDGNNVARSLAILGTLAGLEVRVAAPPEFQLPEDHGAQLTDDPAVAANGAHALYTDVWVSMSDDEATASRRREALAPYRLDDALLDRGAPGAIALHCLPAHPGEEITEAVLYGDRQRIWDQAENRRHAQKALLELLVYRSRVAATMPQATPVEPQEDHRGLALAQHRAAAAKDSAGVREQLARFLDPREVVVLTRERVQEAVDDAVERGRMTRNDATALVTALFERGKTQTDDLIAQIEGVVTGTPTRIVREVDRARRATGIGSNFPISGYDDLTAAQVGERLGDLSAPELRKVRDYERRNANRKSVLQNIERKLD